MTQINFRTVTCRVYSTSPPLLHLPLLLYSKTTRPQSAHWVPPGFPILTRTACRGPFVPVVRLEERADDSYNLNLALPASIKVGRGTSETQEVRKHELDGITKQIRLLDLVPTLVLGPWGLGRARAQSKFARSARRVSTIAYKHLCHERLLVCQCGSVLHRLQHLEPAHRYS